MEWNEIQNKFGRLLTSELPNKSIKMMLTIVDMAINMFMHKMYIFAKLASLNSFSAK